MPKQSSLFRQARLAPGLGVTGEYFRRWLVGAGESVNGESGIEGQDLSRRFAGRLVLPQPRECSCQVRVADAEAGVDGDGLSRRVPRLFASVALKIGNRQRTVGHEIHRIERAQSQRAMCALYRPLRMTRPCQGQCAAAEREDVRAAERQRLVEQAERRADIMRIEGNDESGDRQRGGIVTAMRRRGVGMPDRGLPVLLAQAAAREEMVMGLPDLRTPPSST